MFVCVGFVVHVLTCLYLCIHQCSSSRAVEMEVAPLRKKLGCLRQENASLALENRQLISDLEATQIELASSKTKVLSENNPACKDH